MSVFNISCIPMLLLEYLFLFFTILTLCFGLFFSPISYSARFIWSLTLISSIFTFINYLIVVSFNLRLNSFSTLYDAGLVQNNNVQILKIVSLICLILISLTGIFVSKNLFSLDFIVLLTFGEVATLFVLSVDHVLVILIFLELQALIGYLLTVYKRSSPFATEAGLKYFLLGGISSAILILSLALLQFAGSSFYISEIAEVFTSKPYFFCDKSGLPEAYAIIEAYPFLQSYLDIIETLLNYSSKTENLNIIIGFLFLFGMLFKLSAVPLHFWTPDAYEDVEFLTVGYLSTIPKLAVIGLLTSTFYFLVSHFSLLFVIAGILSLFVGSVNGVYQNNIKRLLAYSTINNSAYLLILFSLSFSSNILSYFNNFVPEDIFLFAIYFQAGFYSISFVMLTAVLQMLPESHKFITSLNYFYYLPLSIKVLLLVLIFSLAGIPPLIGFFSKSVIIYSIFLSEFDTSVWLLAVLLPMFGLLSQFYYTRLVANLFFIEKTYKFIPLKNKIPYNFIYFLIVLALIFNLFLSIFIYNAF